MSALIPLLRWVGGKRAIAVPLAEMFRSSGCTRLIEPFAGGANLFWEAKPSRAVLADTCYPLMDFYAALQQVSHLLVPGFLALCRDYPQPDERAYYAVREDFNAKRRTTVRSVVLQASRFLYLNRTSFHGLWRVNARGDMNAAYGHYKSPWLPARDDLQESSRLLQRAKLLSADFGHAFMGVGGGDFIYCDPPYLDTYDGYTPNAFDVKAHARLAQDCERARKAGATVVISNIDLPAVRKLYSSRVWEYVPVHEIQRIAPQNNRCSRRPEILIVGRAT